MNPLPYSLRQLQYAVVLAELRSFRKAAERCHVSQPSLSAQVALLESAMGVPLFERDPAGVLVTPAGEALIARMREVLARADDLGGAARQLVDPLSGTLRVGIIPTVSPYLLPALAPALRKRFPKLSLLWTEDKTDLLLQELTAARLDATLLARGAATGDFAEQVIGEDAFVLAARPDHPAVQSHKPAHLRDLEGEEVLLLAEGHCFRDQALALCTRGRAHESDFRATSLSTLSQVVGSGSAVTLLPSLALSVENRGGQLGTRRFAAPVPSRTLILAWRKRSPLAPGLQLLGREMAARYAALRS
jgi:LysR family hydrogen peroxide-inducible transcriptional activator